VNVRVTRARPRLCRTVLAGDKHARVRRRDTVDKFDTNRMALERATSAVRASDAARDCLCTVRGGGRTPIVRGVWSVVAGCPTVSAKSRSSAPHGLYRKIDSTQR